MGQLYKEMGFINTGHTVQATRADLVGQYIGHTGPKTKVLHDMIITIEICHLESIICAETQT
jgi:hypothetical protein